MTGVQNSDSSLNGDRIRVLPPGWPLTFHAVGREETDIAGFQGILMGELGGAGLGL